MRYTELFGKTRRDAPASITDPALKLAHRAGLVRPLDGDELLYLPLAVRVLERMQALVETELAGFKAQPLRGSPSVNLDALAASEIQSYKQLPARVTWHSGGQTRVHVASIETGEEQAHAARATLEEIARRVFAIAGVATQLAEEISGTFVWYSTAAARNLEILRCDHGDYAAVRRAARPYKSIETTDEAPLPLQDVETPHCDTIESLARYLQVPTSRTAKAVFYSAGQQVIFAVIRGDLQIDEDKLKRALGIQALRFANDAEIARVGATPGYASPVGTRGATIVVDDSIAHSPNLVAGANREGFHLLNTNVPRDYEPDHVTDLALARPGDRCPNGDGSLELVRGAALATINAPRELSASFLDANGKAQEPFGLEIALDLGAALLAHVGAHSDDKGILWERSIAPFDAHLVALNADKPEVAAALAQLTGVLDSTGWSYLLDDRSESAGVKFNDADLIGVPWRITVGPKTVAQASVELKRRGEATPRLVPLAALAGELQALARP